MLPFGYLGPTPGWGQPRHSRLTTDEMRTMVTLWSISRSPLFIGANLLKMDAPTENAITDPEVLDVDQYSENSHPVIQKPNLVVWMASAPERSGDYVAVFNLADTPQDINLSWDDLGFPFGKRPHPRPVETRGPGSRGPHRSHPCRPTPRRSIRWHIRDPQSCSPSPASCVPERRSAS